MTKTLIFVCWGNICRSAMAERIAAHFAKAAGLDLAISSAGVSTEEIGSPIDPRAVRLLTRMGYDPSDHRAQQITPAMIDSADLVVAAEQLHIDLMKKMAPGATNLALLNDFNPALPPGTPLVDPWYGSESDFENTLADIEAALPGVFAALA